MANIVTCDCCHESKREADFWRLAGQPVPAEMMGDSDINVDQNICIDCASCRCSYYECPVGMCEDALFRVRQHYMPPHHTDQQLVTDAIEEMKALRKEIEELKALKTSSEITSFETTSSQPVISQTGHFLEPYSDEEKRRDKKEQ